MVLIESKHPKSRNVTLRSPTHPMIAKELNLSKNTAIKIPIFHFFFSPCIYYCYLDLFLTSWAVITMCGRSIDSGAGSRMTGAIQGHDYVCKYAREFLLTGIMRRSTEPRELPTWRDRLSETWANNWVMHVAWCWDFGRAEISAVTASSRVPTCARIRSFSREETNLTLVNSRRSPPLVNFARFS